jgi:Glycosyl transferase family 2
VAGISVVVISKNEEFLSSTLDILASECAEVGAECVVVDASGGELGAVREAHAWVRWQDYIAPAGRRVTIAHQRNVGVGIASGDVIAFCDAGGTPAPGWLSHLTSPIVVGEASATGGPVHSLRSSPYGTLNEVPTGRVLTKTPTCNLAFTRDLFDRVGGFDERFDYGSDIDFGWRISDAGEVVVSVADAVMTIDWGDRRRQLQRDLRYGEAKARQLLLRPGKRRWILRESPEVLVYPLIFLTAPIALGLAAATRRWRLLAPWLASIAVLYARDRHFDRRGDALLDHAVVSIGIPKELMRAGLTRLRRSGVASAQSAPLEGADLASVRRAAQFNSAFNER